MTIKTLYRLYESDMQKKNIVYRTRRYIIRRLINYFDYFKCLYNFYINKKKICNNSNEVCYVISFTSFPGRIKNTWRVVENMMHQTNADGQYTLNLYLSKQQFPNELLDLPLKLRKQISRGLNVWFYEDDLRAHKKYYYAFYQFPYKNIITIDDDLIYQNNIISELIEANKKYPDIIISQRAREICSQKSYIYWPLIYKKNCLLNNVLTTNGGGTLFPPKCYRKEIFDKETFCDICKYADDLWISLLCRLQNSSVYYIGNNVECVDIIQSQKQSLRSINNNKIKNENDTQIANLCIWGLKNFSKDFYLRQSR